MDIRELVRLKKGSGGLIPPMNFGILLDRERSGKDHLAVVFTLKGKLRVKWRFLKETNGRIYRGSKTDEKAMTLFLREAVKNHEKKNTLKMEPEQIVDSVKPEDLWRSVERAISSGSMPEGFSIKEIPNGCRDRAFLPADIGRVHFEPAYLNERQIRAVSKVLAGCDDVNEPFFARVNHGKRNCYTTFTKDAISSMEGHIRRLEDLRSVFLDRVEEKTGEGKVVRIPHRKVDDLQSIRLPEDLSGELDLILDWAMFYLEKGRWPSEKDGGSEVRPLTFGLAGTSVRRLRRFDLERYIEFLAVDLTNLMRGRLASGLVTMLLEFGRIDWREANELVIRYHMGSGTRRFHETFQSHILRTAERLPDIVTEKEWKNRTDLTELETYTIDPEDAKDFDDAISITGEGENTVVWVHIADVSHYVRPGDLVDGEARFRSTSVYLPTRVIPMLPSKLSENLCSLREGVERLSLTTKMVVSPEMRIIEWKHLPSVIRVDRNLSYDQVDAWIEEGREPFLSLHELTDGMRKKEVRLRLNTPERRIRFLEGSKIDVRIKRPTRATRIIEELMIRSNECAAMFLEERGVPIPFRVHPLPDRASAQKFNAACETMGLEINIDTNWGVESGDENLSAEDSMLRALQAGGKINLGAASPEKDNAPEDERVSLIRPSKESMERAVDSYNSALKKISQCGSVSDMLIVGLQRTLPHAFYSVSNIGHFGLGSMNYCHFTSPIRRYPDILVHRALKVALSEEGIGPMVGWNYPEREWMEEYQEHLNDMTDSAESWEREMVNVALATRARMSGTYYKGTHSGIVTSITPVFCYVLLEDGVTEARAAIREMSPYPLTVDEQETRILVEIGKAATDPLFRDAVSRGEDEVILLKLGDRVRCRIGQVSISEGIVNVQLI